ncbi:MAG: hypothetical protein ACXVBE_14920 [Bdellovibrionota bacterium]
MKLALGTSALLLSFNLIASASHIRTVEQMSCSEAQAYAAKNKRYYKNVGPDGAIPIYPVYGLKDSNCGGRTGTSPQWEQTLDNKHCIVGYYCRAQ